MATSSFDKKFVVKDPVIVEKVLRELKKDMNIESNPLHGDDQSLDYLGVTKGQDQGLDYLGIVSHTEKI